MLDTKVIINTVLDIIIVADNALKIKENNHSITTIGYSETELIGKSFIDITPDAAIVNELFKEVKEDNGIDFASRRIEIRKKDGTLYHADTSIRKVRDPEDMLDDYLILVHDVEERYQARKALEDTLAETKKLQEDLAKANVELEKRQVATEKQLAEETKFRLAAQQTDFKKDFAKVVALLVAVSLALPYVTAFFPIPEKISDSTANLSLLLLQVLGVISAALFAQQANKKNGEEPQ